MTPGKSHLFDFNPVVRPMRREDADYVVEMINDLAAHHGDVASVTRDGLLRDAFGQIPWIKVLVLESDGGLIGYCVLHPLYKAQTATRALELQHLLVRPEWRGKGMGQRLIDGALEAARTSGCAYVSVGTTDENLAAQSFYLHLGFEAKPQLGLRFRMPLPEMF